MIPDHETHELIDNITTALSTLTSFGMNSAGIGVRHTPDNTYLSGAVLSHMQPTNDDSETDEHVETDDNRDPPVDIHTMADEIADRWGRLLSNAPIPDVVWNDTECGTHTHSTVVYCDFEFSSTKKLLHWLYYYDTEVLLSDGGLFVRPALYHYAECFYPRLYGGGKLDDITLQDQVANMWPDIFLNGAGDTMNTTTCILKMVMKVDRFTKRRVFCQDNNDLRRSNNNPDFQSLDGYLENGRPSINLKNGRSTINQRYHTKVGFPKADSRDILQLYVKTPDMPGGEALPLSKFVKWNEFKAATPFNKLPDNVRDHIRTFV